MIKTIGPQKSIDVSHDFFMTVLHAALDKAYPNGAHEVQATTFSGQGRAMNLMQQGGYYDVIWSGNSQLRNEELLAVQFPLFRGGLGVRGFVIRRDDLARFSQIKTLEDLKSVIFCQGRHWPDADILREAGLSVVEISSFDAMFSMVDLGRCDTLSLSIFEGAAELSAVQHQYPNLVFYSDTVIQYDLVMNFYVQRSNQQLATKLMLALSGMLENGEYDEILETHRLTSGITDQWKKSGFSVIALQHQGGEDVLAQRQYYLPLVLNAIH
ncbi:substrate-binding periplasmic protein [Alteromonas facilis]|uniref:substrate-binding periplasmic protein n=1 Tax=Alteromonas facilis TaxID=2048004 RepID=UPI0013DBA50C|nr:transporter substrate-binding domain-containing protein [Alteromonas facilis]